MTRAEMEKLTDSQLSQLAVDAAGHIIGERAESVLNARRASSAPQRKPTMAYLERFNELQQERANVTRERLGFGCNADMLLPVELEADMAEAKRRIAARA